MISMSLKIKRPGTPGRNPNKDDEMEMKYIRIDMEASWSLELPMSSYGGKDRTGRMNLGNTGTKDDT
jgi:hypothetical protein